MEALELAKRLNTHLRKVDPNIWDDVHIVRDLPKNFMFEMSVELPPGHHPNDQGVDSKFHCRRL